MANKGNGVTAPDDSSTTVNQQSADPTVGHTIATVGLGDATGPYDGPW